MKLRDNIIAGIFAVAAMAVAPKAIEASTGIVTVQNKLTEPMYGMFCLPGVGWGNSHVHAAAGGGLSSLISSIQTGTVSVGSGATSATATITSVDTSRSIVITGNQYTDEATIIEQAHTRIELTNSTTVTAYVDTSGNTHEHKFTIIEFVADAIDSIQSGTISLAGVTSNTATVTSVTTSRSALFWCGFTTNDSAADRWRRSATYLTLTNATTITAAKYQSNNSVIVGYQLVEFSADAVEGTQEVVVTPATFGSAESHTISSVTVANCIMAFGGFQSAENYMRSSNSPCIYLNDSTSVYTFQYSNDITTIAGTVIEFKSGLISSRQVGTKEFTASDSSLTTTVTSVDTAKSVVFFLGYYEGAAGSTSITPAEAMCSVELTNATTLTFDRNTAANTCGLRWALVEFA